MQYSGKDIHRCTSVIHRAVRTLFVPQCSDFLEKPNLTHFGILSLFPFENGDKIAADGEAGRVRMFLDNYEAAIQLPHQLSDTRLN